MKTKFYYVPLFIICYLSITTSNGQTLFKTGTIEYERTQNIPATFNHHPSMKSYVEKTGSEIYSATFILSIGAKSANYSYANHNGPTNRFDEMPADQNTVYEDFVTGKKLIKKFVLGKTYVLSGDSVPSIQWKLTNEKKEIAGYTCRRANGLLFDSIYVVGFFSEQFSIQSGPESFRGLPGMILGISLPSEHISWFATKVQPSEPIIEQVEGGNLTSYAEYDKVLNRRLRKIPNFGEVLYKRALF